MKNIKRTLDPLEGSLPADPNDPLAQDVGGIDTSYPLLPPGLYDMEIKDVEVAPSRNREGAETMTISFSTTADATSTKGDVLHAGFPIKYYIGLTPTPDYPAKDIAKKMAAVLKQSGFVSGVTPRQWKDNPKMVVGRILRCKVVVTKATDEYPEGNAIKSFVPVE